MLRATLILISQPIAGEGVQLWSQKVHAVGWVIWPVKTRPWYDL